MTEFAHIPVVIPCGGKGTRIREASDRLPKPLIDIGGRPILWHIMKIYSHHGFRRFVLPLGYKGNLVKEFFLNYREQTGSFTIDLASDAPPTFHDLEIEDWEITLVDTGHETGTAGRVARVAEHLDAECFLLTYGDGVADIDLGALMAAHRHHGRIGTVTAVHPVSRFGEIHTEGDAVLAFNEKPMLDDGLVNGGFCVFNREFLDYVSPDAGMLETEPMPKLVSDGQMGYYRHDGFWRSMDTYREYLELNAMWDRDEAGWKIWGDAR